MCKQKQKGRRKQRAGDTEQRERMREEPQDMLLYDGLDKHLQHLRKKNQLLCFRDARFSDKTIHGHSRTRALYSKRVATLGRMRRGDGSGHMTASVVVSNVLFLNLSNIYEGVCCINNSLSSFLLWVMLVFMFTL